MKVSVSPNDVFKQMNRAWLRLAAWLPVDRLNVLST